MPNLAISFRSLLHCLVAVSIAALLPISGAWAGGGPENVLLVVNAREATSLAVANHFIHLRNIPLTNVVYLDQVPTGRVCAFELFRERVGDKIIQAMNDRKIGGHIDYIIFSTNFPTAVNCPRHLELLKEQVTLPDYKLFTPMVSTNSLMAFYRFAINEDPSFLSLDANWYFSHDKVDVLRQPFFGDQAKNWEEAVAALNSGDNQRAIQMFAAVVKQHPLQVAGYYLLARALAQDGRTQESISALRRAVDLGWQYRKFTDEDPLLEPLDNRSDFQRILLSLPKKVNYGRVPTRGFNSRVVWSRNGWPNSPPDQGKPLWLSTLLGVTGGTRGNSQAEIIRQLQRSAAADGTMPMGSFLFSKTSNVRSRTRRPQFAAAIADLRRLGFRASEITTPTPNNRADVLGATLGSAQLDWPRSHSRFLPGSLCDNLTSHGGNLSDNVGQTPLTDFLKMGAAGASGTVVEPFAVAQKFPTARIYGHYVRGCNLAEAFYQSVSGPFQLLIVGDPLCQPWSRFPRFSITGLSGGETVESGLEIGMRRDRKGPAISRYEFFVDGRLVSIVPAAQKKVPIPTTELPAGWHQLRIVAIDDTLIGTRTSRQFGFRTVRQGQQVEIEVAGSGKYQLARSVLVSATSSFGDKIRIRHNGRVVAEIQGTSGEVRIDCATLGSGPSVLSADAGDSSRPISSQPVAIEINP